MNNERYIRNLVDDPSVDLIDMYYQAINNCEGLYDNVYSRESLIEIMYGQAKEGHTFSQMAIDLDENSNTDYFLFDWSMWGDGCDPINTKEEMATALLEGCV